MYSIVILSELIGLQVVLFPIVEYKYGRIVPHFK
jgi:hypothetical protein